MTRQLEVGGIRRAKSSNSSAQTDDILQRLLTHALAAEIPRPSRLRVSHGLRVWPFRQAKELRRLDKAVLQTQAARLALENFAAEQHPDWRDVIKYF